VRAHAERGYENVDDGLDEALCSGILKVLPAMHLRRFVGACAERAGPVPRIPENNSGNFSRDFAFRKFFRQKHLRRARPRMPAVERKKIAPGDLTVVCMYG
jgi:hypothetical protein